MWKYIHIDKIYTYLHENAPGSGKKSHYLSNLQLITFYTESASSVHKGLTVRLNGKRHGHLHKVQEETRISWPILLWSILSADTDNTSWQEGATEPELLRFQPQTGIFMTANWQLAPWQFDFTADNLHPDNSLLVISVTYSLCSCLYFLLVGFPKGTCLAL